MNKTQILFRWWIKIFQWWNIWCLVDFDSPDYTRSFIIMCFLTSQVHGTKLSLRRHCGITYPKKKKRPFQIRYVSIAWSNIYIVVFCKILNKYLLIPKCILIFLHTIFLSIGYKHPWCFFHQKDGSS